MALIAVDLTPMMPGGENGGVKILTLELLRAFQREAEGDRFLLLTASWNHDELAPLEGPRMSRLMVLEKERTGAAMLDRLPPRAARIVRRLAAAVRQRASRATPPRRRLLSSRGVDLLFCPFTAPNYFEPGIAVVSVIHDMQHKDYPQFFPQREIDTRNVFMADVRAKASRIICISEHVRESVVRHLQADPDKTHVVYNCIQTRLGADISGEERGAAMAELGIHRRPYMFYPANFWPHKNHRMLLTAYGIYRRRHPGRAVDLVLTGALEGEERLLKQAADRMGIRENVHFLGFLPEATLNIVWQGAAFLVFPSLYEGFGIPVVEAMSLGKPVLCSNVTSLPEVAGDAALFFDPRNPEEMAAAMESIAGDAALGETLSARGRARADLFRAERMVQGYLDVFREALGAPPAYENAVSGVFEDGWTGEEVSVTFGAGPEEGRRIDIALTAPEDLPGGRRRITAVMGGKRVFKTRLAHGETRAFSVPISGAPGEIALWISPTFQPAECGMGPDNRRLGLQCRTCNLIAPGSEKISLWKGA